MMTVTYTIYRFLTENVSESSSHLTISTMANNNNNIRIFSTFCTHHTVQCESAPYRMLSPIQASLVLLLFGSSVISETLRYRNMDKC